MFVSLFPGDCEPYFKVITKDGVYIKNFSNAVLESGKYYIVPVNFSESDKHDLTTGLMITEFYKGDPEATANNGSGNDLMAERHNVIELYNYGDIEISGDELERYSLQVKSNGETSAEYSLPSQSYNTTPVVSFKIASGHNDIAESTAGVGAICPGLICFRKDRAILNGSVYQIGNTIYGSSIRSLCVGDYLCNDSNGQGLASLIDNAEAGDTILLKYDGEVIDEVIVPSIG